MPWKRVSILLGAPLGNLEGIRLSWLFEKRRIIYPPRFLYPEDIKILSLGTIWIFGKGTGLSWADIRLWGTKGHKV